MVWLLGAGLHPLSGLSSCLSAAAMPMGCGLRPCPRQHWRVRSSLRHSVAQASAADRCASDGSSSADARPRHKCRARINRPTSDATCARCMCAEQRLKCFAADQMQFTGTQGRRSPARRSQREAPMAEMMMQDGERDGRGFLARSNRASAKNTCRWRCRKVRRRGYRPRRGPRPSGHSPPRATPDNARRVGRTGVSALAASPHACDDRRRNPHRSSPRKSARGGAAATAHRS